MQTGELMLGVVNDEDAEMRHLLAAAHAFSIPTTIVRRDDRSWIGDVEMLVLYPPHGDGHPASSTNNSSVVLHLRFGSRTVLFTGDIETEAEADLILEGERALRSDLVKVPHHGSRTSSSESFVSQVAAKIAVISVGRRSRFGHPHPNVVRRWEASGAEVLRTGDRGTITIETDGSNVERSTFWP
jgi:competence protein ComEC